MIPDISMQLFATSLHALVPSLRALLAPFGLGAGAQVRVEAVGFSVLIVGIKANEGRRHRDERAFGPAAFLAFALALVVRFSFAFALTSFRGVFVFATCSSSNLCFEVSYLAFLGCA